MARFFPMIHTSLPMRSAYLIALPSKRKLVLLIIGHEGILMENNHRLVAPAHLCVFGQVSLERFLELGSRSVTDRL